MRILRIVQENGSGVYPRAAKATTDARVGYFCKTLPETRITHGSQAVGYLASNKKIR